jgi:hypothetical protein
MPDHKDDEAPCLNDICIACAREIPISAIVCSHCRTYQSRWRQSIVFWGSAVGLATLVLSAATFAVAQYQPVRQLFFWRDEVKVAHIRMPGVSVFVNSGDGDVYLDSLNFFLGESMYGGTIEEVVPKGNSVRKVIGSDPENLLYLTDTTGTPSRTLMREAIIGPNESQCIRWLLIDPNDPRYLEMARENKTSKFIVQPVTATLHMISTHNGRPFTQQINLLLQYRSVASDACKENKWDN